MEPDVRTSRLGEALDRYRRTSSPFYDEMVNEVAERAARTGSLGKSDIGALVAWKRLNASTRWMSDFMSTPDSEVRAATSLSADAARRTDEAIEVAAGAARSALSRIPGFRVGDALASAVIYTLAPSRVAVYDRRAQAGLEGLGLALTPRPGRYGRYMAIVESLASASVAAGNRLNAREIDLALFMLGGPST